MTQTHDAKVLAQFATEATALSAGIDRYRKAQDRKAKNEGLDTRNDIAAMIRGAIPILSAAIADWIADTGTKKGRKPTAYATLAPLDTDELSYMALSHTFRSFADLGLVRDICISIGTTVMHHLEADPVWSDVQCLRVGDVLLGLILTSLTEVFSISTVSHEGHPHPCIVLTDEASDMLAEMREAVEWTRPLLTPMVTQPIPWTSFDTGCYHDPKLARRVPLIRTYVSEGKRLAREAIADGTMSMVLEATNAMQDTRFAIDTRVMEVVEWCLEEGLQPSSSFPLTKTPDRVAKIAPEEWEAMDPAKRSAISRQRRTVRNIRKAAGVDRASFNSDLDLAANLSTYDAFYLPHSLDFRGRSYAVPHFNHQRSDHMKALFQFAEGVALGEDGGDWLLVHLANCGDFGKMSKAPLENRIDWCHDNEGEILMAAADPMGSYDFWSKADSPFCFLQACFEYHAWMLSGFSPDFLSTIAGAADGSCSGLQHYSAITRAEQEAYHVNLLPRDTVGDIYNVVCDAARPTLEAASAITADLGDEKAVRDASRAERILAVGFGRNSVKRNVMTYFYGSARFGMRDQHMQDTMRPLADDVATGKIDSHPYEFAIETVDAETGEISTRMDGGFGCANVLAGHVYGAVVSVAPKADEAASWIQTVAGILAHESLSLIWTTPTGLPVVQRYSEYTTKVANLWMHTDRETRVPTSTDKTDAAGNVLSRIQLLIREAPTKRVAKKRMRSAASPNVIHSMDGSHLQRAVAYAKAEGIHNFAMIHDSFGTHLGNMGAFHRIIRQAFVDTYADYCPLANIDTYARSVLSEEGIEKLPELPSKGTLDLSAIKSSLYAFA